MNINKTMSSALLLLGMCLITACSGGDTPPATTTTSTSNATVVANAGPDQSVFIGTFVTLNGSNSTNAKGTGLTYAWTLKKPAGSITALSNPTAVNPTMTPDVGGTYECTLVVSGGSLVSAPDTTLVIASGTNPPPIADAGTNQNVFVGRPVLLNGSGSSDANNDPLTFAWSFSGLPAGSSNPTIFDRTTVAPSFTPDIAGTYIIQLVVNDRTSNSPLAFVTVIASNKPSPTANAGSDRFIALNAPSVTLDGSGSGTNPPGEILEYLWTFNAPASPPTISNNTSAVASFVPPTDVAATYVAQLKVTEPNHPGPLPNIGMDTVSVTVGPLTVIKVSKVTPLTLLSTCTVTSCPAVPVQQNTQLQLDGSTSLVQPLTYQWSMTPTTGAALTGTTNAVATFAPALNVTGNFTITLTVRDGGNNTNTRSVTIMVVTGPIVNSISVNATSVLPNVTALVTAAISGVTGTTPICTWTPSSPNVVITPLTCTATSATANIRATQSGSYLPSLTVTDTIGSGSGQFSFYVNTPPTIMSIDASPLANTPNPACVSVQLSSNVQSPDGFPPAGFSLLWSTNPGATLTPSPSAANPRFTATTTGSYSFSLTATDIGIPPGTGFATESGSISFSDADAGHALYHNGILNVTNGGCMGCHGAGTHDTTIEEARFGATDLSGHAKATIFNKLQNGTSHLGRSGTGSATDAEATQLAAFFAMTGCLTNGH